MPLGLSWKENQDNQVSKDGAHSPTGVASGNRSPPSSLLVGPLIPRSASVTLLRLLSSVTRAGPNSGRTPSPSHPQRRAPETGEPLRTGLVPGGRSQGSAWAPVPTLLVPAGVLGVLQLPVPQSLEGEVGWPLPASWGYSSLHFLPSGSQCVPLFSVFCPIFPVCEGRARPASDTIAGTRCELYFKINAREREFLFQPRPTAHILSLRDTSASYPILVSHTESVPESCWFQPGSSLASLSSSLPLIESY